MEAIRNYLFSDGGYSPHGFCIAWNPSVLYTHITADLLIAVSYFAIPAIMLVFLRRRKDPSLHTPALLFVVFISACGLSHLMSIVTMYLPYYGLQGILKMFTGIVSFITVLALWKLMPAGLKIPAPATLLAALEDRDRELAERTQAQASLLEKNRQLDQKMDELEAANRELREFAYAASHDLKSPANTLSLLLQDFKEEYADQLNADCRSDLDDATGIVERMRHLVEDVLSYSRVVNREDEVREVIDPAKVFEVVQRDLADDIRRARAEIEVGAMPRFEGFPPLFSILAHNLLSNAVKFRSPDRRLRIQVTGEISQTGQPAFILRVNDNGIGMLPEHCDRIFRLFQRLHRPEDYDGTGLGLALCRRIAVTHGGTIRAESVEGQGSEFIVTFPLEQSHVAQAA